jgi:arylsulfate sulfotransferase
MALRSSAFLALTTSVLLAGCAAEATPEATQSEATGVVPPATTSVPELAPTPVAGYTATVGTYQASADEIRTVSVVEDETQEAPGPYNVAAQQTAAAAVAELTTAENSPAEPVLVLNPFGTNTTGLYIQFDTTGEGTLRYTVAAPGTEDFSGTVKDQDADPSSVQAQLIGVVPGVENTVTTTWHGEDGTAQQHTVTFTAPPAASGFPATIERQLAGDAQALTEGLYAVNGLTQHSDHALFFDNTGVLRGELPLEGYRPDRLELHGDTVVASVAADRLVRIDGLGKVVADYQLEGFLMHHDFTVTEDGRALVLATDTAKDSIEDVLLSVDLTTGTVEKIVDFEPLLADYKRLTQPSVAYTGESTNDWLHLNSLDYSAQDDTVIVSSRETSAVLKVGDVYGNPQLEWVIGEPDVWAGTAVQPLLLEKTGEFPDSAGQHSVVRVEDDALPEGQYYLTMFDNRYWSYESRPGYAGHVPEGSSTSGSGAEGDVSEYRKYLVDENARTYELVHSFEVPYSAIVSNVQGHDGNLVISSGRALSFAEYDPNHQLIARFNYAAEGYAIGGDFAYRVLKYDFNDLWFAAE